jgi:hypothetical protein
MEKIQQHPDLSFELFMLEEATDHVVKILKHTSKEAQVEKN